MAGTPMGRACRRSLQRLFVDTGTVSGVPRRSAPGAVSRAEGSDIGVRGRLVEAARTDGTRYLPRPCNPQRG